MEQIRAAVMPAPGMPTEVREQCAELRSIHQVAGDSLNAAMAATVALYEVTRMAAG